MLAFVAAGQADRAGTLDALSKVIGGSAEGDEGLEELAKLFADHLAHFRIALPHEASALRRGFEARLLALLRRRPVQAAAAFAWLALAALDLERLRGEIERRIAFPAARIAA